MSLRFLKVQTFVVAATLSIAMLLFAAQRRDRGVEPEFRAVLDLSGAAAPDLAPSLPETSFVAPARAGGAWTLDTLPAGRLIAPLVVIEAGPKSFPDSESWITMDDVAAYERAHGAIPQASVVLLTSPLAGASPRLSSEALHFLGEARNIVGVGAAGGDAIGPADASYVARKGIYQLTYLRNLSLLPRSGALAVTAPQRIAGAAQGPARVMALVR